MDCLSKPKREGDCLAMAAVRKVKRKRARGKLKGRKY